MFQSDVARLRREIEEQYEAARLALSGYAIASKHTFITKRQENIAACCAQLVELVGADEAMRVFVEASQREDNARMVQKKPRFVEIKHGMNLGDIEEASGLPEASDALHAPVFRLLNRLPIRRNVAERIIATCNRLYGTTYTLDELEITLYPDITLDEINGHLCQLNLQQVALLEARNQAERAPIEDEMNRLFDWFELHGLDVTYNEHVMSFMAKYS